MCRRLARTAVQRATGSIHVCAQSTLPVEICLLDAAPQESAGTEMRHDLRLRTKAVFDEKYFKKPYIPLIRVEQIYSLICSKSDNWSSDTIIVLPARSPQWRKPTCGL